jgi:hypothetical protein
MIRGKSLDTMFLMTSSLLLILAAPSIASSFVATTLPKHIPIMRINGGPIQRRSPSSSVKSHHRIWSVSPGGSSEAQSTPVLPQDDNAIPSSPSTPPHVPKSQTSGVSDTFPSSYPPVAVATTTTSTATGMGPKSSEPGVLRKTFSKFPWHRLPDQLTYMRCLAIPALVGLFYFPNGGNGNNIASGVIFGLASATDWLDGYLARRWDIASSFGAFLDPVADKLMVSTSLILLTGRFGKGMQVVFSVPMRRQPK